ncbi:MAG: DUF1993 domain-containing protein [Nevskia sp.]|nr:DUF1993 domain-containing protein [Nevskia sp.]
MSISMYQASVPVFIRYLGNLRAILEKAAASAESRKIDPAVLVNSRLYPDMLPLSRQIQLASDMAKSCPARLSGSEPAKFEDTESTLRQLVERIDKTVALLKTFNKEQIDGSEERTISLNTARGPMNLPGLPYLTQFLLPNFLFHVTTAYGILRHNGVDLGKMDYLGAT